MGRPKKLVSAPKEGKDRVTEKSDLAPLPYYPNLKLALKSVTASIVMVYLETHLKAPEPPPGTRPSVSSLPITLSIDKAAADLCISRRTLYVSLCILSSRWKTENDRACAARANREFYVPQHCRHMRTKPYSITGSWTFYKGTVYEIRRNVALVAFLRQQANFAQTADMDLSLVTKSAGAPASLPTVACETLKDIMLRASVLIPDMRSSRYARLWAAQERGLVRKDKREDVGAHPPPSDASTAIVEGGKGLL